MSYREQGERDDYSHLIKTPRAPFPWHFITAPLILILPLAAGYTFDTIDMSKHANLLHGVAWTVGVAAVGLVVATVLSITRSSDL